MTSRPTRRRVLTLIAGTGSAALAVAPGLTAFAGLPIERWQGRVLGAEASLAIYHSDRRQARALIRVALAEVARLEKVFSLYRADSAVSVLNRAGAINHPPLELVDLLDRARFWSDCTDGAFDVTIQPLWRLYHAHFSAATADPAGPSAAAIATVRRRVSFRAVDNQPDRIAFRRPKMAVTLNGIAQGYITDRVAGLLSANGMDQVLVNMGEIAAIGAATDGRGWRVGIADPADRNRLIDRLQIADRALATSAYTGTLFDAAGRHGHLIDPKTGRPARGPASVSVVARSATDADALSTALAVTGFTADMAARTSALTPGRIDRVLILDPDGTTRRIEL